MTSPSSYQMAEGRAQHLPSGLWHYVRGYGTDTGKALLSLMEECARKRWALDGGSVRYSPIVKGESK